MKMKNKICIVFVVCLLVFVLAGCEKNETADSKITNIVDEVEASGMMCATALEKFYEDDKYEYYFSCIKSASVIVEYSDGIKEPIKDALLNGNATINDLDTYGIHYIKKDKK